MKFYKFIIQVLLIIAVVSLLFYWLVPSDVYVEVHEVGNGYGYSVVKKNKTLIKQDFIPAIQEQKTFCSFEEAHAIGELIKNRIEKNESPRVTIDDLTKNKISFLCN